MKYYTVEQASKKLKVKPHRIYYEINCGNIKPLQIVGKKVFTEKMIKDLQLKYFRKKALMSVEEYCRMKRITRSAFDYRKSEGQIKTVKIDGRIFVKVKK